MLNGRGIPFNIWYAPLQFLRHILIFVKGISIFPFISPPFLDILIKVIFSKIRTNEKSLDIVVIKKLYFCYLTICKWIRYQEAKQTK